MATYEVTGPDGKKYEITAPEGATEQQILEYVRNQVDASAHVPSVAEAFRRPETILGPSVTPEGTQARLIGAGRGLTNVSEGVQQLFRGPEYDQSVMAERELYERAKAAEPQGVRQQMGVGEFVGETAPYMAIPGARAGAPFLGRLGAGLGAGALIGGTQFIAPGQDEFAERIKRAGMGALIGGGTATALEPIRMMPFGQGGQVAMDPRRQALLSQGEKLGVQLSVGDVKGGATTRLETMLESVPVVGMGRFRAKQQTQAQKAAETVTKDFSDRISGKWEDVARTSLNKRLDDLKSRADVLYERVSQKADPIGAVPTPKSAATLDNLIQEELGAIMPDFQLISVLGKMRDGLERGGTFTQVRTFRSDVGDMISDYYAGTNALVGAKGVGKLQQLRNSINEDMEAFANQQGGDILKSWKTADAFWKQKVVPFREQALIRRLAKEDDPTASYKLFLSASKQKPDVVYASLGPRGRAAVRAGMLQDAMETAVLEKTGFSPAKFAQSLEKRQNEVGVFFRGQDKQEVEGLMKVMRHAERAGQYAENPPTGNRLLPWLLGGAVGVGAITTPKTVAVAGTGVWALSKLMTTKTGRAYLLAASRVEPGSPGMKRVLDVYAPRVAAILGTEDD